MGGWGLYSSYFLSTPHKEGNFTEEYGQGHEPNQLCADVTARNFMT